MATLKLSSPWVNFYREIESMFSEDPGVRVVYDEEKNKVYLYVENPNKAEALAQLLPTSKTWGSVTLSIIIVPANEFGTGKIDLIRDAFEGNAALSYIKDIHGIFSNDLHYVVFKNKVVQYFNDDLSDVNGMCSTLYQNIAKDIFGEEEGIYFCTDLPDDYGDSLGYPLGEWP